MKWPPVTAVHGIFPDLLFSAGKKYSCEMQADILIAFGDTIRSSLRALLCRLPSGDNARNNGNKG